MACHSSSGSLTGCAGLPVARMRRIRRRSTQYPPPAAVPASSSARRMTAAYSQSVRHLGLGMPQNERGGPIQARVDRTQHSPQHRDRVMRFQHLGCVGRHDRHRVALADAGTRQRRRQAARALEELRVGLAPLAVNDRETRPVNTCRTHQERHRRERHIVGWCAVEVLLKHGHDAVLAQEIRFT